MYACGANNPSFKGSVEKGGVYAVEPFNTTGKSGLVENVNPHNSSNILRVTGNVNIRKALAKRRSLSPWAQGWLTTLKRDIVPFHSLNDGHSLSWRSLSLKRMRSLSSGSGDNW